MIGLPLAFAEPLVLLGLLSLPVLWWLLRLTPPRPRRVHFPPTRLLFDIAPKEETPSRTPWWLLLLRLMLAALLIIAAAGPLWNPPIATSSAASPLLLLIDDGWAAAATWDKRIHTAQDLVARAETNKTGVAVVGLSESGRDISLETPGAARVRLEQMRPKPYTIDRSEALTAITRFLSATQSIEAFWLSDGVDLGRTGEFIDALKQALAGRPLTVVDGGVEPPRALTATTNTAGALTVKVLRGGAEGGAQGIVRAVDLKGLPLGDARFAFNGGERESEAQFDLPVEIRNDIARLEIAGERSSGAVQLLDKRWRRRTIGVVSGATSETAQPLLASTYYLARALGPFADLRIAERSSPTEAVKQFLDQGLPMLVLADVGTIAGDTHDRLAKWIEQGGVLVRFAGPRLAASDDDLVPVKLRRGGRILGGSLSWDQPQALAAFSREGPFATLAVPNDVTVTRQVLAEPDSGLSERTWATLVDGTPLVTFTRPGKGVLVLFHVTADTRWSNLPLSGAFVDMLRHIVELAGSSTVAETGAAAGARAQRDVVPPSRVLDGFGAFVPPPASARPVPSNFTARATADHPPGFYGPPEGLLAVNTLSVSDRLNAIDFAPLAARREAYRQSEPQDLRAPLFLGALGLSLIDAIIVFSLAGGIRRLLPRGAVLRGGLVRRGVAALLIAAALAAATWDLARAAERDDQMAMKATTETKLAYVVTGDAEVDGISKAGLQGLTMFLAQRTALEAGEPVGLDIGRDELAFYPLIYWPIVPGVAKPSAEALARIDAYMKQGGTVLFDTRDAIVAPPGPGGDTRGPGMAALRQILSSLDIPELEPVPRDHVLTKTFFLLKDFPGRYTVGPLWVEATAAESEEEQERPARAGDGVSSILITSNDFAGAWAMRPDNQPMLPLVPGEPRQREFAFRAGVNIVMYTLTGNYKADQVHVPALLERLGQ
jgi:uncharacterized protein DUF4159/aerotolerance regulator-like protein